MHLKSSANFDWKRKEVVQYNENKIIFLQKSCKMRKWEESVTFWKIYGKLLLFASFFLSFLTKWCPV